MSLSICTTYYNSHKALASQEQRIRSCKHDYVIVDDGSPTPLQIDYARVYRIPVDIFFNLDAINLSVLKATGDYIFRQDLDHWADYDKMAELELPEKTIFHFERLCNNKFLPPNPSHILIRKADYIAIGGWNTIYSGYYGCCDNDFVRRAQQMGYTFKLAPMLIEASTRLSTPDITRDPRHNRKIYNTNPACNTNWNIDYETVTDRVER